MPLRDGFFSTATQTSCCNRIQRSNRVRLLVVSTHDFPDSQHLPQQFSVDRVVGLLEVDEAHVQRDFHLSTQFLEFADYEQHVDGRLRRPEAALLLR